VPGDWNPYDNSIEARGGGGCELNGGGGAGGHGIIVITYYVPSRSLKILGRLKIYGGKLLIHQAQ